MRKFFDYGNRGDIERVAGISLERADAALAENDVVIAARQNVFGAHQKFFHGGGHAAFQQDGFADFAKRAKEKVVLHVARANLKNVHVTEHHLNLRRVHHFADGEESEFVRSFAHELEARFPHALEGVRRSARFEGAASQNFSARFGHTFRDRKNLFARLDRTRARGNGHFLAADFDTAPEIDNGAFRLELAARKFERLGDAHDLAHAVKQFEVAMIEVAVNADGAKHRMRFAGGAVDIEAAGDKPVDDMLDLRVRGPFLHHNDHESVLFPSLRDVVARL